MPDARASPLSISPPLHATRTSPHAAFPAIVIFRHPPSYSDTGMTAAFRIDPPRAQLASTDYPPLTHRSVLDIARPRGRLNRAISDMWGSLFRHRRAISPQRIETSMLTAIWPGNPRSRAAPCPGPQATRRSPGASRCPTPQRLRRPPHHSPARPSAVAPIASTTTARKPCCPASDSAHVAASPGPCPPEHRQRALPNQVPGDPTSTPRAPSGDRSVKNVGLPPGSSRGGSDGRWPVDGGRCSQRALLRAMTVWVAGLASGLDR